MSQYQHFREWLDQLNLESTYTRDMLRLSLLRDRYEDLAERLLATLRKEENTPYIQVKVYKLSKDNERVLIGCLDKYKRLIFYPIYKSISEIIKPNLYHFGFYIEDKDGKLVKVDILNKVREIEIDNGVTGYITENGIAIYYDQFSRQISLEIGE